MIEKERREDISGYRGFVNDLKSAMILNFDMTSPKIAYLESQGLDFSINIDAWMGLIEEDIEKMSGVCGIVEIEDGKKKTKIVPGITKPAKDLSENCSRSSKLLSVGLALAKLEIVSEMASEVFPTLDGEIQTRLKYLEEMKKEIISERGDTEKSLLQVQKQVQKKWQVGLPGRLIVPVTAVAIMTTLILAGRTGIGSGNSSELPIVGEYPALVFNVEEQQFLEQLEMGNQYLGIVDSADPNHVVSIGGGYPFNSDPQIYSNEPFSGIDYHFAVVNLSDADGKLLDSIDVRRVVKAGDVIEVWYTNKVPSGSRVPVSARGVPAYYWNSKTGLAVSISGINGPYGSAVIVK